MKKTYIKIIILSIVFMFMACINSFAESSFRFMFENGKSVNPGEIVEVPIIIDRINIDGAEKKIYSFSGVIEYNTDIFELVPYVEQDGENYLKVNTELKDYGIDVVFDSESQKIKTSIDAGYFFGRTGGDSINYLNNYIEVGTMKFKAKENATKGEYSLFIKDIEASNGEFIIKTTSDYAVLYINGEEESDDAVAENETDKSASNKIVNNNNKKVVLKVEVSEDGKKITITPDEVNGEKIQVIKYKNNELKKENGKFIFNSEPNMIYEFFIYGVDGECLGNEFVKTIIESSKDDGKKSDESKDENSDNEKDKNNEENNNQKEDSNKNSNSNEKKSPQTGDYLYIVIAILVLCIYGFVIVYTIKKSKIK